jgi:hypothetical protein
VEKHVTSLDVGQLSVGLTIERRVLGGYPANMARKRGYNGCAIPAAGTKYCVPQIRDRKLTALYKTQKFPPFFYGVVD